MRSSLPPSLLEAGELLVSSSSPPPSADDAAQFLRGYSAVSTGYELEAEAGLQPVGTHLVGWRDRTPLRPPAERDVETSDSARHGDLYHRCARIGCFVALCLASYVVTRVIAMLNLPTDGRRTWQGGDFAADVGRLCECAVVLAWLTGVDTAGRTRWLVADPSRAFGLILLFVAVSPAFSALNSVPGWDKGLASIAAWAPGALAVLSASSGVGLLMILWLVLYAYRHLSRSAFVAYVATRLCIIAYYGLAYGAALGAYDAGEELRSPTMVSFKPARTVAQQPLTLRTQHHLYIAFVVASFGSFNTLIVRSFLLPLRVVCHHRLTLARFSVAVGPGFGRRGRHLCARRWVVRILPAGRASRL